MTVNQRIKHLERILEVTRNLSAKLDHSTFLQSVISVASEVTSSEIASILEYNEEDAHLHFVAAPWFHRDSIQDLKVPLEESIAGWVYQHGQPLVIQDVKGDERYYSEVDSAAEFQTHSVLAVPLLMKGKIIGVLEAINKTNRAHYTGEDVTSLETLASLAAFTLHDAALQEHIAKFNENAQELEKMKNDFIAIASHELRTPLGLILGHATFLREVVEEEHHEQLDTIVRGASRLKEIIESLANVNNFESGAALIHSRKISVPDLVDEVIDSLQKYARERQINVHIKIKGDILPIEGDSEKISIAITNLLKNAIMFTPVDGNVSLAVEQILGYIKISIVDNGMGISESDLPHIFERFYQAESHLTRQHGGMGLGLSVAKAMIEMHGGRIWAESVEGKGSQFTILLPLEPSQDDDAQRVFDE